MERMKAAYPELILFNGFDEQFAGSLAMGADAAIGTTVNVFAPLFLEIRSLFEAGKVQALWKNSGIEPAGGDPVPLRDF